MQSRSAVADCWIGLGYLSFPEKSVSSNGSVTWMWPRSSESFGEIMLAVAHFAWREVMVISTAAEVWMADVLFLTIAAERKCAKCIVHRAK